MMRNIVRPFALIISLASAAAAQTEDGLSKFSAGDATMNTAIVAAQESLPLFLCEGVDKEGYGPEDSFLKVRVPVESNEMTHEIIWIGPFAAWDGENFAGFLANQPVAMPGLNQGDQLDFTLDMIVDWSWYHPSGATYGHYTTRVIYAQEGLDDALAELGDRPYLDSWSCD